MPSSYLPSSYASSQRSSSSRCQSGASRRSNGTCPYEYEPHTSQHLSTARSMISNPSTIRPEDSVPQLGRYTAPQSSYREHVERDSRHNYSWRSSISPFSSSRSTTSHTSDASSNYSPKGYVREYIPRSELSGGLATRNRIPSQNSQAPLSQYDELRSDNPSRSYYNPTLIRRNGVLYDTAIGQYINVEERAPDESGYTGSYHEASSSDDSGRVSGRSVTGSIRYHNDRDYEKTWVRSAGSSIDGRDRS